MDQVISKAVQEIQTAFKAAAKKAKDIAKQAEKSPEKAEKLADETRKQIEAMRKIVKKHAKNSDLPAAKEIGEVFKQFDDLDKKRDRKMIDCEAYVRMSDVLLKTEKKIATEVKKAK